MSRAVKKASLLPGFRKAARNSLYRWRSSALQWSADMRMQIFSLHGSRCCIVQQVASYPTSLRLTVTESGDVAKLLIMTTEAALRSASSNAVTSMSPRGHSACMDEHQGIADCGQSCHLRRLGNTELHQSLQGWSPGAVDSPTCKGLAPGQRPMVAGGRLPQGLLRTGPWRKARRGRCPGLHGAVLLPASMLKGPGNLFTNLD